jgi:glutaredoxin
LFSEVDVSVDVEKAREMVAKSGQYGVPVLDIDGEIVVGFDRARINALLGLT